LGNPDLQEKLPDIDHLISFIAFQMPLLKNLVKLASQLPFHLLVSGGIRELW
jgi:hypothetical protein